MDPVTQGLFGALWAQAGARGETRRPAAVAGMAGGMAPDLDVLIRSPSDPLLAIEFHRHFTHALAFVPAGALVVALVLWPVFRRRARFGMLYCWSFLGFASHGLLDACTSYGTQLGWPISDYRAAWNLVSVIDPVFSVPLALLLAVGLWQRRGTPMALAAAWCVLVLGFGAVQQHRAEKVLAQWAGDTGIAVQRLVAKPAFANQILWRGLVDDGERFHLAAIRNVPGTRPVVWPGGSVAAYRQANPDPDTRLARDLARFRHFSSDWLFRYYPYDSDGGAFVGDLRYAIDPASTRPLWGVRFDPEAPAAGAAYVTPRRVTDDERRAFFARLKGRSPE